MTQNFSVPPLVTSSSIRRHYKRWRCHRQYLTISKKRQAAPSAFSGISGVSPRERIKTAERQTGVRPTSFRIFRNQDIYTANDLPQEPENSRCNRRAQPPEFPENKILDTRNFRKFSGNSGESTRHLRNFRNQRDTVLGGR